MSIASDVNQDLGPVRRSTVHNRPDERVSDTGAVSNAATIQKVVMRTVKCDRTGVDVQGEEYSHIKSSLLAFELTECRRDMDTGRYEKRKVLLKDTSKVTAAKVELNGAVFDLLGKGKLEFIFDKAAGLPVQGSFFMQYTSPGLGQWYVDDHPLEINFMAPKQDSCCVLM